MNKKFLIIQASIFGFLIIGCNQQKSQCPIMKFDFQTQKFKAQGCMLKNGAEDGEWVYYDENNAVVQQGRYNNGIREGVWKYPFNVPDTIIAWRKYGSDTQGLKFNIPDRLKMIEETRLFVEFSNQDPPAVRSLPYSINNLYEIVTTLQRLSPAVRSVPSSNSTPHTP